MKRGELQHNFGSGMVVDSKVAKQATNTVVVNSSGTEDAILLLDMLGLIPPQPGNEPKELGKTKAKINLDGRRERTKQRKQEQLDKMNVTPEEMGEVDEP